MVRLIEMRVGMRKAEKEKREIGMGEKGRKR